MSWVLMWLACAAEPGDTGTAGGGADAGAGDTGSTALEPPGEEVASEVERDTDPDIEAGDVTRLTLDNLGFGLELLQQVAEDEPGNIFLSPHSVSVLMGMTYAGSQGATELELAEAMRFTLPEERLHPAFNALDLYLQDREDPSGGDGLRLTVVDQLFGQTGYDFEAGFLDTLARHYGAGMRLLDFAGEPDANRELINSWVSEVTEDRIVDLLPEGSVTSTSRLVMANAIYFKGRWYKEFEPGRTTVQDFHTLDGRTVKADTMHGELRTRCGSEEGYALAAVPYVDSRLNMTLVVPDEGRFEEVQAALTGEALELALDRMDKCGLTLALPRFSFRTEVDLVPLLEDRGMVTAFIWQADFSGITSSEELYIAGLFHQAFVAVDEQGTEAAAATAEVDESTSEPDPFTLVVDRPFLFLIRDVPTGAVLFLGRVVDPTE